MSDKQPQSSIPNPVTEGPSPRGKWGAGGLGAALILSVSLLAVEEKTKLALSALSPIVAVWLADAIQRVGRWWAETMRKNDCDRQFKMMEADLQRAIATPETSEEHRKELVAALETLHKDRLKAQKATLEQLTTPPTKQEAPQTDAKRKTKQN